MQTSQGRESQAEDDDVSMWVRDLRRACANPGPGSDGARARAAGGAGECGDRRRHGGVPTGPCTRSSEAVPGGQLRVLGIAAKARDRRSRVRSAAIELTRELEVFSMADWERVLAGLGIPNPAQALATLMQENTVFEPKAGFFRAVTLSP